MAGLDGDYLLWPVPQADALDGFFARLRSGKIAGANVTIPWKVEAVHRCDELTGDARIIGAVNTLVADATGRIIGHNTDASGLAISVVESFQDHVFRGAQVTVIGAGGAARSAIVAAQRLGVNEVRVYNRTAEKARAVCESLGLGTPFADLEAALAGSNLVLQASALGFNLADDETDALAADLVTPLRGLAPGAALYDLVYKPSPTAWMLAAGRCGFEAVDGLGMLVHQAARAFAIWTGYEPDPQVMLAAARAQLASLAG